ncbi:MAG: ChaN family lipoprotein [Deltaproteobacteria bacterium]|nr:ChaN family lipoprotein [Deltaproteobacteria bacterium]
MRENTSTIVDLLLGEPVTLETALDDMSQVRVVYVGEFHTIARHHELQEEILRGLVQRNRNVSLAMEMFNSDQQPVVDKWLSTRESVSALAENLGSDRWTNLLDYSGLLLKARDFHIPVAALNISSELVRKVSRGGLNSLSETERSILPPNVEPINPDYARLLSLKLKVHRAFQGKTLDRVIYAQALRDAAMASNIIRYLNGSESKDGILMVIAGNGHLNYGLGVPERVKHGIDVTSRIILPSESGELELSEAEKREAVDIEISHEDLKFIRQPIADYLSVIPIKSNDGDENGDSWNVAEKHQDKERKQ